MDGESLALDDAGISTEIFGYLSSGHPVLVCLLQSRALKVRILPWGGRIVSLRAPDRHGVHDDVVLGFDGLEAYMQDRDYFGAIVGRYANRIAGATFEIDGRAYELARNDGRHCLHGGDGLDRRLWSASIGDGALTLTYVSPDGEAGFPGKLTARVRYQVSGAILRVDYEAVSDRATHVNFSNHSYFNLAGGRDVLGHELTIPARRYLAVDDGLIPRGPLRPASGTPFDFLLSRRIGDRMDAGHEQLRKAGGYDHCWVINDHDAASLKLHARLRDPVSGRVLEILSTEPALQFYSGNFLDGSLRGRNGVRYTRHAGLCLEPQHFPDSPNRADFPSTLLRPGETFRSTTLYRFGVDDCVEALA